MSDFATRQLKIGGMVYGVVIVILIVAVYHSLTKRA